MHSDGQPIPEPKHTNEGRYFENDNLIKIGLTFFSWGEGGEVANMFVSMFSSCTYVFAAHLSN